MECGWVSRGHIGWQVIPQLGRHGWQQLTAWWTRTKKSNISKSACKNRTLLIARLYFENQHHEMPEVVKVKEKVIHAPLPTGAVLISNSLPSAQCQPKLHDHVHRDSVSHSVFVYLSAFAGTNLYCMVTVAHRFIDCCSTHRTNFTDFGLRINWFIFLVFFCSFSPI